MTRLPFLLLILPLYAFSIKISVMYPQNPEFFDTRGQGKISGEHLFLSIIALTKILECILYRARLLDINWSTFWAYLMSLVLPAILLAASGAVFASQNFYDGYQLINAIFCLILIFKS